MKMHGKSPFSFLGILTQRRRYDVKFILDLRRLRSIHWYFFIRTPTRHNARCRTAAIFSVSSFKFPASPMSKANHHKLCKLSCSVQNYDWGKMGEESMAGRLYALNSGSVIENDRPYAEFWMGTHPSGPSHLRESSTLTDSKYLSLKQWISKNPDVVGFKVLNKWGCDLPFLVKILSVSKALSIQAHPDKELAQILHKSHPHIYKDSNHKPEMALAVTKFEALCGFVSLEELKNVLQNVPEIVELVGHADRHQILYVDGDNGKKAKALLRSMFTQIMFSSKERTTFVISKLKSRLQMESRARRLTEKEQLVLRLQKQYPADVGVLSSFFFNYVKLNPGEALYVRENELHAYIHGECVECMATSDNVVRAGLTPKHRDVETLCSMLTYEQGFPEIIRGYPINLYTIRYRPPMEEFEVDRCVLPKGASTEFPKIQGPSIFVIVAGEGVVLTGSPSSSSSATSSSWDVISEGNVLFAPANFRVTLCASSVLHVYRAGVNGSFLQSL